MVPAGRLRYSDIGGGEINSCVCYIDEYCVNSSTTRRLNVRLGQCEVPVRFCIFVWKMVLRMKKDGSRSGWRSWFCGWNKTALINTEHWTLFFETSPLVAQSRSVCKCTCTYTRVLYLHVVTWLLATSSTKHSALNSNLIFSSMDPFKSPHCKHETRWVHL